MSYCRNNGVDSDVYVIAHIAGGWTCYCSPIHHTDSINKMLRHLNAHARRGDHVPDSAILRLKRERALRKRRRRVALKRRANAS